MKLLCQLHPLYLKLFLISYAYLPRYRRWILVRFCVDTGANLCAIPERDRIRMGVRNSDLRKLKVGSSGIGGKVDLYEAKVPMTFEFTGESNTFTYEFQGLRFMRGKTKAAQEAEKIMPPVLVRLHKR